MKNIFLLFPLLLFPLFVISQSVDTIPKDSIERQIKQLIRASFDEILSDLNIEKVEKFYTKDFLLLENGKVWNNDTIRNYLTTAQLRKEIPQRENKFEFIKVERSDSTAWVAYHNYATFYVDQKIIRKTHWLESATVLLTEDGWKLQMLHSTPIKHE